MSNYFNENVAGSSQFADLLGCSSDTVSELENLCDPKLLKISNEVEGDPLAAKIPPARLATLTIQKDELRKRAEGMSYKQMACNSLKFRRMNFKVMESYARDAVSAYNPNYTPPDVIITVHIMKPHNRPLSQVELRLGRLMSLDTTFLVLGSTPLVKLRDDISCLSDYAGNEDCSSRPDLAPDITAKDLYKSGFFYINETFYNDSRDAASRDLSSVIRDWCSKRTKDLGPFHSTQMENYTFADLNMRLGQPYLYLHQGTCEHLMVFADVRLMHPEDCQDPQQYPIQISCKMKKRTACCACKIYTAKWVTYRNIRCPIDPAFFCQDCFLAFNYAEEKGRSDTTTLKKLCDFEAVMYIDRQALD